MWILRACVLVSAYVAILSGAVRADSPAASDSLQAEVDSLRTLEERLKADLNSVQTDIESLEAELEMALLDEQGGVSILSSLTSHGELQIRPDINSAIVAQLEGGTAVIVHDEKKGYFFVSTESARGWVSATKVETSEQLESALRALRRKRNAAVRAENAALRQDWHEKSQARRAEREREQAREKAARRAEMVRKYGEPTGSRIANGVVWIGMTAEMARDSWGAPESVNKTISAGSVSEQWVYPSGRYLYLENGVLETIQTND